MAVCKVGLLWLDVADSRNCRYILVEGSHIQFKFYVCNSPWGTQEVYCKVGFIAGHQNFQRSILEDCNWIFEILNRTHGGLHFRIM